MGVGDGVWVDVGLAVLVGEGVAEGVAVGSGVRVAVGEDDIAVGVPATTAAMLLAATAGGCVAAGVAELQAVIDRVKAIQGLTTRINVEYSLMNNLFSLAIVRVM